MREILFRGKRIDDKQWIEGSLGCWYESTYILNMSRELIYTSDRVFPYTVGQYTGLKDKNGRRIFEGDIIRAKIEGGNHEGFTWQNMPVDFQQGAFCLNDQNGRVFCVLGAFAPSVSLEVIGNIHDNPELIAEVQDG